MLETSIILICLVGVGFLAYCIRACYMSKCNRVKLGCIEIERNVNHEQNVSQLRLDIPK